jgi:hypothetical protein
MSRVGCRNDAPVQVILQSHQVGLQSGRERDDDDDDDDDDDKNNNAVYDDDS